MSEKVLKALPAQILVSKEPQVLHFNMSQGTIVCAHHPARKMGGGVLLRAQSPSSRMILSNLLKAVAGAAQSELKDLSIKVIGRSPDVEALQEVLRSLEVKVQKELKEDLKNLEAYFYSDSGRLRVAADSVPQEKPQVRKVSASPLAKKRILIVDDSKVIRNLLSKILSEDSRLEVVGTAERPSQVEAMIRDLKPDVITLDIHMPEMDGVTLLKTVIMPKFGIPTVMISSITMEEGPAIFQALEYGAVDYVQKPSLEELDAVTPIIRDKVYGAASSRVKDTKIVPLRASRTLENYKSHSRTPVVCIGSSTGGTEALRQVFLNFPAEIPPVVVVQHIPPVFSLAFAKRLNELLPFEVKEAVDNDEVRANRILIAPGGFQMKVKEIEGVLRVKITDDAPVNRFKPSVDYLFESCASVLGKRAIGVILTGMGSDGAQGLLKMRQAGAKTIGQDEATCVVYGMPRAAAEVGAVEAVRPLDQIAFQIWDDLAPTKR